LLQAASKTVWAVLEATAAAYPDRIALQQPIGNAKYLAWTWREYADSVRHIAVGLRGAGVAKGDIVALQSETRAEFYLADQAVMACGAVAAALYTSLSYGEQAGTLRSCRARVAFVEDEKALRGLEQEVTGLRWILLSGAVPGCLTLDGLRTEGQRILETDPEAFDRIQGEYNGSDLAVLYMTSGATGEPKMGLVTHSAIVSNLEMGHAVVRLSPDDCTIAFLPSAHIAQRVVAQLLMAREGVCVWFSEGLSKLPHEIRTIRPTFFLAPPRVWERVYSSICAEIRKRPAPLRRLFHAGVGMGAEASRLRQSGKTVPGWMRFMLRFFDRLIFTKIRDRLGGRIRIAISGAAPLGKDLAEFYAAIGMPLVEGFGLTEGGVATINPLDCPKPGSIGKLLPGVEARIEEDGELMLRSPCLFSGYFEDPAATAAVLRDGWLATGDIAEMDKEGFLYITGRKKELIVASNGKKIYPARIEALLKREPLISNVLLIGDRLPYVTALVTVTGTPAEAQTAVAGAVKAVNRELPPFEQIRKFKILDRELSIQQGELTPTMKVRRNRVLENHRALVSEMYAGRDLES
jgi:long-chain acyl-CoA synthetase